MTWRSLSMMVWLTFCMIGLVAESSFGEDLRELARAARWKALTLQQNAPDDLVVNISHPAAKLRFAEWVYGTPESPRIAVVLAEASDGSLLIYADADRDRGITERDLLEGQGELRMASIAAQHVEDNVFSEYPRQVLFRSSSATSDLSVATATLIENSLPPDASGNGLALATRQIDGNANGLFSDSRDLLQIDMNHDGRFDPFQETFPFRPVIEVRSQRWFVKADQFGKRLELVPATATGRVRVVTKARSERDLITELIVTLSGEDGSVYSLVGVNAETDLPVGRYAPSVLFIAFKPGGTDRTWEFTFSRDREVLSKDWLEVSEGNIIEFDPIGQLVMNADVERTTRGGAGSLSIQPQLFTGSGLLINQCQLDGAAYGSGPQCQVSIAKADGRQMVQSSSGFA